MKKIKDFLPDDVRCEVNTALVLAIERYADCTDKEIERVLADFLNIWDTEIPEPKGVEPVVDKNDNFWTCGNCKVREIYNPEDEEEGCGYNFCPNCGTKIKWEVE